MAHTLDRCEHDSVKWFPRVTVEKYSPDQSAWAERHLRRELSWGRRLLVDRLGVRVPRLHGDWLREAFSEPEDGYARCQGNSMVNGGLDKLTGILVATSPASLLSPAQAICGVGSNAGTMVTGSTALLSDTGSCWYQQMDALYPAVDGTTHGQLDGQSTFTSTTANGWSWVEWCWASTTTGTITGGATLSGVSSGTETMFNRWSGTTLGQKGAGATWVFSSTVTFSLYVLARAIEFFWTVRLCGQIAIAGGTLDGPGAGSQTSHPPEAGIVGNGDGHRWPGRRCAHRWIGPGSRARRGFPHWPGQPSRQHPGSCRSSSTSPDITSPDRARSHRSRGGGSAGAGDLQLGDHDSVARGRDAHLRGQDPGGLGLRAVPGRVREMPEGGRLGWGGDVLERR